MRGASSRYDMMSAASKASSLPTGSERARGVRILAKSIFKELSAQGYDARQIVSLATEIISEVTADLQARPD